MFGIFNKKTQPLAEVKSNSNIARSPYSMYRGSGGYSYIFQNLSLSELIRNYQEIAPLYAAVSRLSEAVASLPYTLVERDNQLETPHHPALSLLRSPNNTQHKIHQEFIRDHITWFVLTGDSYIHLGGNVKRPPLSLNILNPQHISHQQFDNFKFNIHAHTERQSDFKFNHTTGKYQKGALEEVYHILNFNPDYSDNSPQGESEIKSLFYELNHYIHASKHNLGLLANGARPSGAFLVKSKDGTPAMLSEEAYDRLRLEINDSYVGAHNAGSPLLLEGGLEWEEMQMSPKDLDFHTLKTAAEEKIYTNLGIPIALMSSVKTTAGNMDNLRLEFYENRVLPLGESFVRHLNNFLLSRYPDSDNLEFIIDRDQIDVLISNRQKRRDSIEKSLILTINEKRKEFLYDIIEGGDKIVDPNGRPIAGKDAKGLIDNVPPQQIAPPPAKDEGKSVDMVEGVSQIEPLEGTVSPSDPPLPNS